MTQHPLRPVIVVALAACAMGFASSCITPPLDADNPDRAVRPTHSVPALAVGTVAWRSIAQLDYGRQAHFANCTPPACPSITPKTLAIERPVGPAPRAAIPATDPSASPSPGEAFATADGPVATPTPPAPPTSPPATRPAPPEVLVKEIVVTFPFASAALTPAARALIDDAARQEGVRRIAIRGRTDNVGPVAANDALSRLRAAAVAQYLRARHPRLSSAEVSVDARGACCYAGPNDTTEGRARNRRVEIAFDRDPS